MADAYRIAKHLYQGPAPSSVESVLASRFSVLVLCAQEIQPWVPVRPDLVVLRIPLLDDPTVPLPEPDWQAAAKTARELTALLRTDRHRALVTCMAGRNRSGLVSALTVSCMTGMSGREAVDVVRRGRGDVALTNPRFVERLVRVPRNAWG